MALVGVHYSIRFTLSLRDGAVDATLPRGPAAASQTMATAATSGFAAPSGRTIGQIKASAPIFYAVGKAPDATNGPRNYHDPADGREDFILSEGDYFSWIFA